MTVEELFRDEVDGLAQLGWHVELERDCVSLHRRFKSGKMMKGWSVALRYMPLLREDLIDAAGGWSELERPNTRPYRVESKRLPAARTFKDVSKAVVFFMEEARGQAPGG